MPEVERMTDNDWNELLDNIRNKECTPFIGAGACSKILPLASEISEEWAMTYNYPFQDKSNLARVAEYLAISHNGMYPRRKIQERFRNTQLPDFSQPDEPHSILARLDLPIYITTNYDSFMSEALRYHKKYDVKEDFCRWNDYTRSKDLAGKTVFKPGYNPTSSSPLVFHFHGSLEMPQSMVLTESDYLDFLINFTRYDFNLPRPISKALASTSLLFLGYGLADFNLRVLFRGLINQVASNINYNSVAVQLPPTVPDQVKKEALEKALTYLDDYLDKIHHVKITVYWGDVRAFCKELHRRWEGDSSGAS